MSTSAVLDLAQRLWPQARDRGVVDDPADLDVLLGTLGMPGAPGYAGGLRRTFACFPPGEAATFALPTGEHPEHDEAARFVAHVLVLRVLLAVGLGVDERVSGALAASHALSWARVGGAHYGRTPLEMTSALWLIVLDPDGASDRPLAIDWSPAALQDPALYAPDVRLFSHYDVRERAIDWAHWVSRDRARHEGVSIWTMVEPLLRLGGDARVRLALAAFANTEDTGAPAPAAAMLERNRIAQLLRVYLAG